METFQTFAEAKGGLGLTIFDIDKTLFTSDTKINIKKDGKVVKRGVSSYYRLKSGEEFDYGEFIDANRFARTASPIGRALLGKQEGDEVIIPLPDQRKEYDVIRVITVHDNLEESKE